MADAQKTSNTRRIVTWVTIFAMIGLAYFLREQIAETIQNIARVNAFVLLLLIPLHVVSYYSQGQLYRGIFAILGHTFRTRSMYRLGLEVNFINNVFPSGGVSGFSYLPIRLRGAKVSTGQATLVQAMRFMLVFSSFLVLLPLGVLLLSLHGRVNNLTILAASSLTTLLVVATFLFAYIIGNKARIRAFFTLITKGANRVIHVIRPKHPETINVSRVRRVFTEFHENYMVLRKDITKLRRPLMFALLFAMAEIGSIYAVYVAFGQLVNPGAIIIAYAIANFAGVISVLPGGIGAYEALMTAVLIAAGVPASVSLPVTIMYRVLNMGLALPQGGYLYYRAMHGKSAVRAG